MQRDTNKAPPAARRVGSSAALDNVKKVAEDKAVTRKPGIPHSTTPARRTTARPVSNPTNGSPAPRAVTAGARRLNTGTAKSPTAMRSDAQKKAFSPPRSPVILADKDGEEEQSDLSGEHFCCVIHSRSWRLTTAQSVLKTFSRYLGRKSPQFRHQQPSKTMPQPLLCPQERLPPYLADPLALKSAKCSTPASALRPSLRPARPLLRH